MQVKVAPVSSTNLYGPCPLILTGTMIAASFGGANSKLTSPGAVSAGTPKSFGAGMTQPDHATNKSTTKNRIRWRIIVIVLTRSSQLRPLSARDFHSASTKREVSNLDYYILISRNAVARVTHRRLQVISLCK